MIVIPESGLIGDSLACLPALQELYRTSNESIYLHLPNVEIRALIPAAYEFRGLSDVPVGESGQRVTRTHCSEAFGRFVQTHHMVQAHFGIFGLPIPDTIPRAEIIVEEAPEFDYVISPWSISDHNHNKKWFEERWSSVFTRIEGGIAVLGSNDDPQPWEGVEYVYGRSLRYAAGVLKNARRAVITIDNGMSHLAFHAGARNHVLLYPACLPAQWVVNPNAAVVIRKEPRDISVDEVVTAINRVEEA